VTHGSHKASDILYDDLLVRHCLSSADRRSVYTADEISENGTGMATTDVKADNPPLVGIHGEQRGRTTGRAILRHLFEHKLPGDEPRYERADTRRTQTGFLAERPPSDRLRSIDVVQDREGHGSDRHELANKLAPIT
jgi:hypothetical protein